ncbi:MAG: hypothetical protein ABR907_17630 [Terracidiphilus sp.]|jgi:hypothetical protein
MHPNFDFTARQILWTLTFAAQLVLLVVLLGRDRARRYPWFTAFITLSALRLMAEILLMGRMAMLPLNEILLSMADLSVVIALLVLVEIARRAFVGVPRSLRIVNGLGLLAVAGGVLAAWGPWIPWKQLTANPVAAKLNLMLFVAAPPDTLLVRLGVDKGTILFSLLAVELGIMVVLFGRSHKAGWRSHAQMISVGLSSVSIAWLALQGICQNIARTAHPQSKPDADRLIALVGRLINANKVVYLAALIWWIVWLWLDEPKTSLPATEAVPTEEAPAEIPAEVLPEIPEQ